MIQNCCVRCGPTKPTCDFVSAATSDGMYRLLCSRCFNEEMAQFAKVHNFEHPGFTPIRLLDANGDAHEFHFRNLLLGDQLSLEAFELAHDDVSAGYRFQILGDLESDPFALLGQLIQKMRRALATKHLSTRDGNLQVAESWTGPNTTTSRAWSLMDGASIGAISARC